MQKTENISIGQKPFVCDLDAYKVIHQYLNRAEKNLKSDPDKDDIIADIETSMAKHFEEVTRGLVIDKLSAQEVIEMMGEVVSLEADSDDVEKDTNASSAPNQDKADKFLRTELYKDRDRGILLGVCAGVARAIHINPFWIRATLVLITILTYGVGSIVIYIILGLIMRDEPSSALTADEIVENVKEKSRSVTNWATQLELMLQIAVRYFVRAVVVSLQLLLLASLIILGSMWSALLFFMISSPSKVVLFGDSPKTTDFVAVLSAGLVILIPLFMLITQLAGSKATRNVRFVVMTWCVWTLSLLIGFGSLVNTVPDIKDRLIQEQPQTRNILVESQNGKIVHACFEFWGDCRSAKPVIVTKRICDVDIQVAPMSERNALANRSWLMWERLFVYPVSADTYCEFVNNLHKEHLFENIVLIDQSLNDEASVIINEPYISQHLSQNIVRKMWQANYYTRDTY